MSQFRDKTKKITEKKFIIVFQLIPRHVFFNPSSSFSVRKRGMFTSRRAAPIKGTACGACLLRSLKDMDTEEILRLLEASEEEEEDEEEGDDWPTASLEATELFPHGTIITETDTEDESQVDEVESSSDAPSTSTAHLDDLAVHPSPNHASNQRRVVNRSHLFHRDSHFRKMFPADTDEAARQQVTEPTVVSPVEYFSGYISEEIWNALTLETQKKHMSETGNPLALTVEEMKTFIGITFVMSVLKYPRQHMYWQKNFRIKLIADCMSRKKYELIRSNLRVVDNNLTTPAKKKMDKVWKIRPLLESVRGRCLELDRPCSVSVDEMMIPFTGRSKLKVFMPRKPTPNGLKMFALAAPDGMILDLEFYQGKEELIASVERTGLNLPHVEKMTVGEAGVLRFVKSVPQGTSFYFDRFFTTPRLLEIMDSLGMGATGTLKKSLVPNLSSLKTEKQLKKGGRGTVDSLVRDDNAFSVTVWYDSKPIFIASNEHGINPVSECKRWSKKDHKHVQVPRPRVVEAYNTNMGGVDVADQVLFYYRSKSRTAKFSVRTILHLFDLACGNSWLEYRHDCQKAGTKAMDSMMFKMQIAESLISGELSCQPDDATDSESDEDHDRKRVLPLPSFPHRTTHALHMPTSLPKYTERRRCRYPGCPEKTRFSCTTCKMFLCLSSERNCYSLFHVP